jgi:hypothetical protein
MRWNIMYLPTVMACLISGCATDSGNASTADDQLEANSTTTDGTTAPASSMADDPSTGDAESNVLCVKLTSVRPAGSWQCSCRNARRQPTDFGAVVLFASCKTRSGSFRDTSFFNPDACSPDLSNCNGHLQCGGSC